MYKKDYENPDTHLFYCEKTDWYEEDESGNRSWDMDKVDEFWVCIRQDKMAHGDYDFTEMIFPQFPEKTFWEEVWDETVPFDHAKRPLFNGLADFREARFLGSVNFGVVHFAGIADFKNSKFEDSVNIRSAWFKGATYFNDCFFAKDTAFFDSRFFASAEFFHATFTGESTFRACRFNQLAAFSSAQFRNKADFSSITCSAKSFFGSTRFERKVDFNEAEFAEISFHGAEMMSDADFSKIKFSQKVNFDEARFQRKADFTKSDFQEARFVDAVFLGKTLFKEAIFNDRIVFQDTVFTSAQWNKVIFNDEAFPAFLSASFSSSDPSLFQEVEIRCPRLLFSNVIFYDTVQFQRCDLQKVEFTACDIDKVNFSNCLFRKYKNRLILNNDNDKDYTDLSNTYRQLKKNRMDAKDWINAGDAYRSEMVMTRRLIWYEFLGSPIMKFHLFINWFIRCFYEFFSGYHQSLTRPIFWLIFTILSFAAITTNDWSAFDLALRDSLNASLPIVGKIEKDSEHFYWLVAERILSVIFLAFFVLATRTRLRQ